MLSYEHAIRKHCYKTMAQQGLPFKLALEKSWKDATVKEKHFTAPLALYAKRGYGATATATPLRPTLATRATRARARARPRARRGMLENLLTSRYASATIPREAARRKLSATSSTCACYVLGIILLRNVPRKTPRIPRAKVTDTSTTMST